MENGTSWPEAAVAIAGIMFITTVIVAGAWQIFATWRARMLAAREDAYRKLAEDAATAQHTTSERLQTALEELAQLRRQTTELERVLKEVG
jgi:type VI protein secretion system component VasK